MLPNQLPPLSASVMHSPTKFSVFHYEEGSSRGANLTPLFPIDTIENTPHAGVCSHPCIGRRITRPYPNFLYRGRRGTLRSPPSFLAPWWNGPRLGPGRRIRAQRRARAASVVVSWPRRLAAAHRAALGEFPSLASPKDERAVRCYVMHLNRRLSWADSLHSCGRIIVRRLSRKNSP